MTRHGQHVLDRWGSRRDTPHLARFRVAGGEKCQHKTVEPAAPDHDPWASPPPMPIERRELRKLQKRSDAPALRFLAGHIAGGPVYRGPGVSSAARTCSCWCRRCSSTGSCWCSCSRRCTSARTARHSGAAGSTRWSARVCGFVLLRSSLYFKYRHADHHTYTQDPSRDPDLVPMPGNARLYIAEVLGASAVAEAGGRPVPERDGPLRRRWRCGSSPRASADACPRRRGS